MKKSHKIGLVIAGLMVTASWIVAFYYWDKLPSSIPTHFGVNGQPDAWNPKSVWYSFMIPGLQTIIFGAFMFLYYRPQYSDMPTTLLLMAMEEKKREHAFALIRTMLVGISLWIGALFNYLSFAMNYSAITEGSGLIPWMMFGIMGGMIIWLIWWTVKVYKLTKKLLAENGNAHK